MRPFHLLRDIDESGVSGTGVVAEGIEFTNRKCVISWLTKNTSLGTYDDIETLERVHGHAGKTRVIFSKPVPQDGPYRTITPHEAFAAGVLDTIARRLRGGEIDPLEASKQLDELKVKLFPTLAEAHQASEQV